MLNLDKELVEKKLTNKYIKLEPPTLEEFPADEHPSAVMEGERQNKKAYQIGRKRCYDLYFFTRAQRMEKLTEFWQAQKKALENITSRYEGTNFD